MKDCEMVNKNLCTGCTGLAENDWIGKEQCKEYQRLKKMNGFDMCKKIIGGISQCQTKR